MKKSDRENYIERECCKASFLYFLRYCKIIVAPTQTNPGGVQPLELYPHVMSMVKDLLKNRLTVWWKSRQVGASTTIAAYVLWLALFKYGATILLFSKGKDEAKELLAKSKRMYMFLPEFLKLRMNPSGAEEIGFPVMESLIKTLAATESAGVSYTASLMVFDEWDFHEYAVQNFMSAKPTISAGGQFVGATTTNVFEPQSLAKTTFKEAYYDKSNGFGSLFIPYDVVPGRDQAWYDHERDTTPESLLDGLTRDVYMSANFPRTVEEALNPPQEMTVFNVDALKEMEQDCKKPVWTDGTANIYKHYVVGDRYIAGTDVSHGVGQDYSVTCILNKNNEVVADIITRSLPPEEFARVSVDLLNKYHSPVWFIEDNDWGRVVISVAEKLGYKHLGEIKNKVGWHTDNNTRKDLFGDLVPAINSHQITIYNRAGYLELYDSIRNAKKEGKIEAKTGRHDDYLMALAIAYYNRDKATGASSRSIRPMQLAKIY